MANVTIYTNGVPIQIDEKELKVPKERIKVKGDIKLGRKDRILVTWLANRFGISYNQAIQELTLIDKVEPESTGII